MPGAKPDPGFWRGRRILLTGRTGFRGAWPAFWLHHLGADVTGIALPRCERCLFSILCLDELAKTCVADLGAATAVVTVPRPEVQEMQVRALDPTLARSVLGWTYRLPGHRLIAETAAWYRTWARNAGMPAVTLPQIPAYEALS
jgi:hypothetical protein